MPFIAPIVEGHGEVEALPALLHRIAKQVGGTGPLRVNPPIRVKAGSFLRDEPYFQKQVLLAAAKAAQAKGTVLIVLDCEDYCPKTLGPELLHRAKGVRPDVNMLVVLAYREFETWFVTAAQSLRNVRGLPHDLEPPPLPESIRDAKGWLGSRMSDGYDPVVHQLEFARKFDLDAARANPSFGRFFDRIGRILEDCPGID